MIVQFKLNINDSWVVYEIKTAYVDTDNEADAIELVHREYGNDEEVSNIDIISVEQG